MKFEIAKGRHLSPNEMVKMDVEKYLEGSGLSDFEGQMLEEVEQNAKLLGDDFASRLSEIIFPSRKTYDSEEIYLQNWIKCLEASKEIYSDVFVQKVVSYWKRRNVK